MSKKKQYQPPAEISPERLAQLMQNDPSVIDPDEEYRKIFGNHQWKKQPLDYVSSKFFMLDNLMPLIPYRNLFAEGCVGCSPIFLNRRRSKLEVLCDKYTGISNYYRVMKLPDGVERLRKMIEESVVSKELFNYYFDKLREHDKRPFPMDMGLIEEADYYYAFYWFYTLANSLFSRQEVCRITNRREMEGFSKEMWDALPKFPVLHERLQGVIIHNSTVVQFLDYWDREDGVYYIDPPYPETAKCFKHNFTLQDHIDLLEKAVHCKGWVGISSYKNALYDNYLSNHGFQCIEFQHNQSNGFGSHEKVECLYVKD